MTKNIFEGIPCSAKEEIFEELLLHKNIKIERICSTGQTTPEEKPYLQAHAEWVIVLKGEAEILFCDEDKRHRLTEGDFLFIPANCKHRVTFTSNETIWLAIHIL